MRRAVWACVIVVWVGLACGQCAWALDPGLDVSQYAHTTWKVRDGFAKGAIIAIVQTLDGYIWLGTEFGLYRFDGVRAVAWQPPGGEQLPNNNIRGLLVARDGTLWIATLKGLASWKDGKLTTYPEAAGQIILGLLQDREGTIWFGAFTPGRLCAIQGGKVQCYGAGSLGRVAGPLYEDNEGNLWAMSETGLWRWKPGLPREYTFPRGVVEVNSVMERDDGILLLATNDGLKQLAGGRIQSYVLPGLGGQFRPNCLVRSRDGSLWVGSHQGLFHMHQGKTDAFGVADGLSGESIGAIFEDREGDMWVSTLNGLDRFREYAVPRISWNQGLSASNAHSIQAAPDGAIWIGTPDGLNRRLNGHVTIYSRPSASGQSGPKNEQERNITEAVTKIANNGLAGTPESLGLDDQGRLWASSGDGVFYFEGGRFIRVPGVAGGNIYGIAGDGHGKEWINHQNLGLLYLTPGNAIETIPWPQLGRKGFGARALLPDRSQGGVWLGFYEGGLIYLKDGQVRASYTAADGLGSGRVNGLRFGSRGTLWASTEGGLSRIRDGHVTTLTSKNGLPCDEVHWTAEDDDHFVWAFQPCGLARIARSELDAWVSDPGRKLNLRVFDNSDGVGSIATYGGYGPRVTQSPDGKIWFVQRDGVSVIDPRHLPFNKVPPPVQIEQITADRKAYDVLAAMTLNGNNVRLPALVRDLEIDYTALSLVVPEKIQFRTKLEGWDSDWQDVGNRRQAFYTGLGPKRYRFRVMACNNSGVWNEAGTFLDFSIAPAYYQTIWFRVSCAVAFLLLLVGFYRLRLGQLARQFDMRMEERVNERTRIARELHDTLLQSFHGLMFQFQAARNMLPRSPEDATQTLDRAILTTEKALAESRDAIRDLRPAPAEQRDLAGLLKATGQELGSPENGHLPEYRVIVEGEPQRLTSILQYEIYRIAREVIRNAFHHAVASRIEVEIRYDVQQLRLRIRDDGKGIEENVLQGKGPAGHWGISGMRERATKIGSRLEFWSEVGAGTEVELRVPAAIAYEKGQNGRRFRLFRKAGSYERHV